ncbi:MAG: hypothetical protein KA715_06250 [Xanthomonadaceae bacterium]|nr:hypothetical protein [Xanthomonadaceae bacterium]
MQDRAEKLLIETGLTIDLISAGNIIVSGTPDKPKLVPIDFELIQPSESTFEYYQKMGINFKRAVVPENLNWVFWPLMPESILVSNLWNLSYEQSIDYVKERFRLKTRLEAIKKLASIPRYSLKFSESEYYDNVERASAELKAPKQVNCGDQITVRNKR